MDEAAFERACDAPARRPCVFDKAVLSGSCACMLAARRHIAERESIACASPDAHAQCAALCALLRQNAVFALKLTQADAVLPHAKAMKLQCGGLRGLQRALGEHHLAATAASSSEQGQGGPAAGADVRALVAAAREHFGGLENLPYSAIVQSVAAYQIRRRRPRT